jgi:hypothetical protein
MSYPRSLHKGTDLSPVGVMNGRISPHPVPLPMGEGTLEFPLRIFRASLLQPHPLADAATLRRKLAKASLRGEGQDEGRNLRSRQNRATAGAYVSDKAPRHSFSSRVMAP